MSIPNSYTETEFATYLHGELGGVAGALAWTVAGHSYDEVLNDTLHDYGEPVIANITGQAAVWKLRQLGLYRAWEAAWAALSSKYDYSTNQQSFRLSQLFDHAKAQLAHFERRVAAYGVGPWAVQTTRIIRTQEPYAYIDPAYQTIP